jgi:hypothetical protein
MDGPRSAGDPVLPLSVDDIVRLRKTHPCGGRDWRVARVGADIGLVCTTCGRRILLDRRDAERGIVAFVSHAGPDGAERVT